MEYCDKMSRAHIPSFALLTIEFVIMVGKWLNVGVIMVDMSTAA